ncbi:MAG TPA: DoxX family protein [Polyangiaceae bacterium]|jgi:putative oxidoreductase|nr:DoxX family protein [Polyangiaceae bacterium]
MNLRQWLFESGPRRIDAALLLLRLWFGLVLAFGHGWGKVTNLSGFTQSVTKLGMPMPEVLAVAAAASEFGGGLLLAAGLLTRAAAIFVMTTMLVATFVVHANDPFMKKEFALAYAFAAATLLIAGAGRWSVDARLFGGGRKR